MPALARGGSLPAEEKEDIATRMSAYSGLSTKSILQYDWWCRLRFFGRNYFAMRKD
jgi:hypothetical protein